MIQAFKRSHQKTIKAIIDLDNKVLNEVMEGGNSVT